MLLFSSCETFRKLLFKNQNIIKKLKNKKITIIMQLNIVV